MIRNMNSFLIRITRNLIQIYGMSMLIPLLLNITFGFIVFYNDYTYETASKYELIPCFMMLYPQWKVLKYLVSYCFFHKDEHILRKEKMIYERDVATLEPYLEATIQVKLFIAILLNAFLFFTIFLFCAKYLIIIIIVLKCHCTICF